MGGLFGKRSQSTTPQRLNGISINQSVYGNAIPLLYGTSRIPLQLIDYVDFKAIPHSEQSGGKGGGGGSTSSYTYTASIVGLLCEGPIAGVLAVFMDKAQVTLSDLNLTLFKGAGQQPAWSYMIQNHPTHALPYDHMAHVDGANFDLGGSAGLPNLTFEVQGLQLYPGSSDAEPSDILLDYCTEPNHGIGFKYLANLKGTNSYSAYCIAMDFLISPQESTQRQGQDFIREILQLTNSNAVFTPGVGLRIVPYADQPVTGNSVTYTPILTPIYSFKDLDYIYDEGAPPVERTIIPAKQTFNVWTVEYLNRANQYNVDTETFKDEQDIAVNGERAAPTVQLHSITRASVALQVATLLCLRNLYIRSTFKFKVRADFSLLEPMDYVAINDSIGGIVNQLVRITQTEDDEDDFFTVTAEEMLVGPASAPFYDTELNQGYAANYEADPGAVAAPYIFTAPPALAAASGGYEEWIAVTGAGGLWGGSEVWASMDNITYDRVGIKTNPSRYGFLVSALGLGSDPDTGNVLSVAFTGSLPITLDSATRASADAFRSLLIVDGEVIAYQNSTPLGNNRFSLTYLRRGLYGSTIATHAAGSSFAVLDDAIWRMRFDPGLSGQPVWFKFVSFNIFGGGAQDISQVTAYQAFFQGQNHGQLLAPGATPLIARGDCVNVGSQIYKKPTGSPAWDSDCYSIDAFAGGCVVRFRAMQTNANLMLGLNSDPATDQNFTSLDHVWYLSGGTAYIYESGTLIQATRNFTTDDIFEIKYDGRFVTYYISGVQYRTVPNQGEIFFLDSSFFAPGSGVDNVYFGSLNPANPSPFVARGQCRVSDEHAQKIGGTSAWDSDVYSLEGYPTCHVTWKCNANNVDIRVGLGQKPGLDSSYQNIDFAFACSSNGLWQVVLSGVGQLQNGPYDTTTRFAITYDGTTVTFLVNGVSVRTVTAAGLILFVDSSFFTPGAGINTLQYGPTTQLQLTDTTQIGQNAASQIVSLFFIGVTPFTTYGVLVTPTSVTSSDGSHTGGAGATVSTDLLGTITSHGSPVAIDFTCSGVSLSVTGSPSVWSMSFTIYRDGSAIATCPTFTFGSVEGPALIAGRATGPLAFTFVDAPAVGSHTYTVMGTGTMTGGTSVLGNMINSTLKIREILR